ncbi:MAG TPA: HTTM domain-containing protein [Cyclobacteriaceae bacterium]
MKSYPHGKIHNWLYFRGALEPIGLMRIIIGFMIIRHIWTFMHRLLTKGFYRDRFHLPYLDWLPQPSEPVYIALLIALLLTGCSLIIGFQVKKLTILGAVLITYHFFLNQIWYRHNRYFMILLVILLCFTAAHRIFSWQKNNHQSAGLYPYWPHLLIRLQMTFIYLASAFSKTLDPYWRSGQMFADRWEKLVVQDRLVEKVPFSIPQWFHQLFEVEWFPFLLSFLALFQEYFLGICLWIPKTRKLALWVGLLFHGFIEIAAHVLVFSYLVLATYFVVIRPAKHTKTIYLNPGIKTHRFIATIIHHLDWLNKIKIRTAYLNHILVQHDGKYYTGSAALAVAGSSMILPFLICYPVTWFAKTVKKVDLNHSATSFWVFVKRSNPGLFLWVLTGMFTIYFGFLLVISGTNYLDIPLQSVRYLDVFLIFLIFYFVTQLYQDKSIQKSI